MLEWEAYQDLVNTFFQGIDASEAMKRAYSYPLSTLWRNLAEQEATWPPNKGNLITYREGLKKRGLKATTIQLHMVSVRRFFTWLTETNQIPYSPATGIKGAKASETFIKGHLSANQAANLLSSIDTNSIKNKRDYAIIYLMLTTGLRTIEIVRANVRDMAKLEDNTILYVQGKGRDDKDRYVKLAEPVKQAMESYLNSREKIKRDGALFCGVSPRNRGRLTTKTIRYIIKEHLRRIGIDTPMISAHSLRHTAATIALDAGVSIEEVQQILRHKNINTTMLYNHSLMRQKNMGELQICSVISKNLMGNTPRNF